MTNKVKILLAEDDINLGFVIRDNLEQHGFLVDLCQDGVEALEYFAGNTYQICILDVMMPKLDGFELAMKVRSTNGDIPILFLTAKTMKEDRLRGFLVGGDDYITKPFSIEELICRINVFLKRSLYSQDSPVDKVRLGQFIFDPKNLVLHFGNSQKPLTQMESDILLILCQSMNEVTKRSDILNRIWGEDDYFNGRSLDVFISRLRKMLAPDPNISIENQHGVGFRLKVHH